MVHRGLIVDLRSADYTALWQPAGELAARVLTVRILSPTPRGGYAVISYPSKLAKGQLAAELVRRAADGQPVSDAAAVTDAWAALPLADARLTRLTGTRQLDLYTR